MTVAYLNDEVVVKEAQRRLQAYLPIDWEGNWYNAMDAWLALIAGTPHFHTFATAYVSRRHRRFTLALTRVRAHESMLEVADRLRQRVAALDIAVEVYWLDRQFWTYELQVAWQEIPYIMPIRRTGKIGTDGGTRPLFDLKASQWATSTMSPKHQDPLHIDVAVVVLPETRQERRARLAKAKTACEQAQQRVDDNAKRGDDNATTPNKRALTCAKNARAKAQARLEEARAANVMTTLCDAINRVANWSLKRIYSTYRGRFGIESSYRQSRQARLFTSSRKPWFRLLIFGLSMMLRNLWLEVR